MSSKKKSKESNRWRRTKKAEEEINSNIVDEVNENERQVYHSSVPCYVVIISIGISLKTLQYKLFLALIELVIV